MLISAISDLDVLGKNLNLFFDVLKKAKEPDLLLFAGDMYEYKSSEQYKLILSKIKWKCPIVAVFGNREFEQDYDEIRKICGRRVVFLDDEIIELEIDNKTVGIVGSKGCLDKPTFWQMKNIQEIWNSYKERFHKLEGLLKNLKSDIKILLTHYTTTYKTLKGENPLVYSGLGSRYFEKLIIENKITLAIHGHAHYGIPLAFVDSIPVFNVAFSVNNKVVEIDPEKLPKSGLRKFV